MSSQTRDPSLWPDVHHGLISEMQAVLNRQLRPQYHVRVEERVYISDENDPGRKAIIPDVAQKRGQEPIAKWPEGCSALLDPDPFSEPIILTTLIEDEIREARLEVIDTQQHTVVTVIELLSPTNKINGSRGRASYEQKRREVMLSSSHFVEIDLLREGDHLHTRELLPPAEYYVHVSRKDRRSKGYVWPIRLPLIGIPLREGDPDANLDLQEVLATANERAAYDLQVNYRTEPTPPLATEMAEWANTLLTATGKR